MQGIYFPSCCTAASNLQALPPLQLAPLGAKAPLPPLGKAPLQPVQGQPSKTIPDPLAAPSGSRSGSFSFAGNTTSGSAGGLSKQQIPVAAPAARQTSDVTDSRSSLSRRATDDAVCYKRAAHKLLRQPWCSLKSELPAHCTAVMRPWLAIFVQLSQVVCPVPVPSSQFLLYTQLGSPAAHSLSFCWTQLDQPIACHSSQLESRKPFLVQADCCVLIQ